MNEADRESEVLRDATLLPPREQRGCPPGEAWIELVGGFPSNAEREKLLDHLALCPDCSSEVRALRDVEAWSRNAAGHSGATPRRPFVAWPWAAALAAVVLLPLLTMLIRNDAGTTHPAVRGKAAMSTGVEPRDSATLDAAPSVLRWPAVSGAREYRVLLLDGEGSLLWESPPRTATTIALPQHVRARIARGKTYLWRVEILLDGDRRSSPTYEFRVAP